MAGPRVYKVHFVHHVRVGSAIPERSLEMDYVEDSEPCEGDYILRDAPPLGSRTFVGIVDGGSLGEFESDAAALKAIRMRMETEQFFPNVWRMSDHGNLHLVTRY